MEGGDGDLSTNGQPIRSINIADELVFHVWPQNLGWIWWAFPRGVRNLNITSSRMDTSPDGDSTIPSREHILEFLPGE